jgi:hypothetical protein
MYAAVPMFEVLVPFKFRVPDWTGSTVSIVAAENVCIVSELATEIVRTH